MSSIASARLAAISVPTLSNTLQDSCIGLPVSTVASNPPATRAYALYRQATTMHPNDLLLQKHGVTSPRLCNVPDKVTIEGRSPRDEMTASITEQRYRMEEDEEELRERDDIVVEDDHVMIDDDEDEDDNNRPPLVVVATRTDDLQEDKSDDERDAVSLCSSEDSELSVGQEDDATAEDKSESNANFLPARRLLLSNVSDMMSLCRPSAFSNVSGGDNGSDARSSVSTDCDTSQLEEEQLQQSVRPAAVLDPFAVANALRIPVPLVPPPRSGVGVVPVQLQEELLRKSHLYAEELMKQQMQLMAAARASAFTLRQSAGAPTTVVSGASFRPQQQTPNYSGIHTHLSAISKMSQLGAAAAAAALAVSNQQNAAAVAAVQLGGSDALAKLTAFGMSSGQVTQTAAAANASNLNQLQAQMQAHLPAAYLNNNNNINHLHESSLKFSIDNILKADFGRRITDPLLKRGGSMANCTSNGSSRSSTRAAASSQRNKKSSGGGGATSSSASSTAVTGGATTTRPMDLTSQICAVASSVGCVSSSFSTSLANICTNSNDSSSTAVSSTYGNSDALKSPCSLTGGAASACSVSPAPHAMGGGSIEAGSKSIQDNAADGNGVASSNSSTSSTSNGGGGTGASGSGPIVWPAWVYCTRYSDRPSSGPRARKPKKPASEKGTSPTSVAEDKRPRTAFSGSQLARLKHEFTENRYLTEKRRQQLSAELGLNEAQIKIWFQNKRAKLKKSSGTKNPLALQLMAQGLYNHSTVPLTREEEELQELQERENAAAAAAAVAAGTVSS